MSKLELLFDNNEIKVKKFHVSDAKQIILDLENTSATDRVIRSFDTSEFSGSIVFVSAYRRGDLKKDIRVALQLRDNVRSIVKREQNSVVLEVENRFGVFSNNKNDKF